MRKPHLTALAVLGVIAAQPSLADVRVNFTKMTVNDCNEIGTCDWKLTCSVGNQQAIEFFSMAEANTNEEVRIGRVLTQREFPPVTVTCTAQEHDGGIGAEWEDVGTSSIIVNTTGGHTIQLNQHRDEGDVTVHFVAERIGSTGQPIVVVPRPGNDFNNDGSADILWHNAATAESQIWFMHGSSRIGRATVVGENGAAIFVGPPWNIVSSNDFNGDGKVDVLWHNDSTGETQLWFMDGHQLIGRATVVGEDGAAAFVGPPWNIVGSNDFNGDGKADVLWHNDSTGESQLWFMNGHRLIGRATVVGEDGVPILVGAPWVIVGNGDFNGDRKTDTLWHNDATGEAQLWFMDGHRVIGRATVLGENGGAAFVGPPWNIVGSNDFDRDGVADILWHNGATGESQVWFMKTARLVRRSTVDANLDGGGHLVGPPWIIMRR